ncbi:hypothetical protein OH818_13640 [Jiella pelagia]|uniref:Uncharacterized protein n=1 Tax=Jiella pelagia TaxID=2986949 RepID=A0ABY7C7X8_9HYPH|nr:hypothetical protein [Jiella pelagia]WAP70915.1 hypothetical protein OH818_13640 [Jiella pelagia]
MSGQQREIYEGVQTFLTQQSANLAYVDPQAAERMRKALADPACYKGSAIHELKADFYGLKERIDQTILAERTAVFKAIDEVRGKVEQTSEFQVLEPERQAQIQSGLEAHKERLDSQTVIGVLRDRGNGVRSDLLPETMGKIVSLAPSEAPEPRPVVTGGCEEAAAPYVPPPSTPSFVRAQAIHVSFAKTYLEDEGDVDDYLQEMKRTLLAEIGAGRKVIV